MGDLPCTKQAPGECCSVTALGRTKRPGETSWMRCVLYGVICLTAFASVDTFNTQFTGITDDQAVQQGADIRSQVAAISLWSVLLLMSFIPGMALSRPVTEGLAWPALPLGWGSGLAALER